MTAAAGTPGDFAGLAGRRTDPWLIVWLALAAFVAVCMTSSTGPRTRRARAERAPHNPRNRPMEADSGIEMPTRASVTMLSSQ